MRRQVNSALRQKDHGIRAYHECTEVSQLFGEFFQQYFRYDCVYQEIKSIRHALDWATRKFQNVNVVNCFEYYHKYQNANGEIYGLVDLILSLVL